MLSLEDQYKKTGVITHSSGNHGICLSLMGEKFGVPIHVVMPENAPKVVSSKLKPYKGQIRWCESK